MAKSKSDVERTQHRAPRRQAALERMGKDIRGLREAAELSQQEIADLFGWTRDSISKVERGITDLALVDYLVIMSFVREIGAVSPGHPAMALVDFFYIPQRRTAAVQV